MSQQRPNEMYMDFPHPTSRSPSSSRTPYSHPAFPNGFSLPRHSQRPFDSPLGSSALYSNDRVTPGGYTLRAGMDQMSSVPGLAGGYMLDNNQSWAYNANNVATISGPLNGGGARQRGGNRRTALPSTWTDANSMGMHPPMPTFQPPGLSSNPMSSGLRMDQVASPDTRSPNPQPGESDQLIPTAIVIKNIPFAIRKETLAQLMTDLHLPQPYAFNYHFDGGIFRGLAFANFQSPEDTRLVIETMNGLEVHGRKLRVEYKKMLPEAERERIEREKRERRGQLEEQHRGPVLHQQPSLQTLTSMSNNQQQPRHTHLRDLDLNDPITLQYYTELTIFQRDESREILIYPSSVSPEERRQIHILAHYMGLEHRSVGDADSRQIQVIKPHVPSPTAQSHTGTSVGLDLHRRGLSRAATFDFAADRDPRGGAGGYPHAIGRQGPTLELPGSPDGAVLPNNLRTAKSFADLRSFSPSPSHSSSSYLNPATGIGGLPTSSLARLGEYTGSLHQAGFLASPTLTSSSLGTAGSQGSSNEATVLATTLSSLNLGSFESSSASSQNRSAPGAIGSHRPSANGSSNRTAPERQPRGPEWESASGFSGRNRVNGHMQRGSGEFVPSDLIDQ
ncbi:hypothetical protein jhhlp_008119 [Lomentospora prolificans]|uniref:RRM domain-containing protein n=1 Tax=Lomentospora prolificans TaxID=41688 RepID=A0A2N3MZJ4_9PEZI|nr:hypothetical protein jhhlp_008119 [Lomentospora prolificans]